jgi:histidinol-phosphate aminotransferase
MTQYDRLPDPGEGLRLHLNENTAGCSPRVIEALQRLTARDLAFYPDYTAVNRDCANFLGVTEDRLLLTNGLDEGLLAACIANLQRDLASAAPSAIDTSHGVSHEEYAARGGSDSVDSSRGEAIIVEPTFGMYADCVGATGGVLISVQPIDEFEFPLDATLAAITPRTRLVFLTNPGNPTGLLIPREALRAIAKQLPAGALLFIDEAYADFTDEHFLDELPQFPNVVIGRTFAKSYGLAAVRIGAVIGAPDVIARLRRSLPPYSINVLASTVLSAALNDREYGQWYRQQVERSRALVYGMCDRLGLKYWRSHANFVLVRVGGDAPAIVDALAERKIFVRDRSTQPGCAGCIRITTGVVEHTEACLTALEEVLCARA